MSVFVEGGKPENPEKNPRNRDENQGTTNNKLNSHTASTPGIDKGEESGYHPPSPVVSVLFAGHPCIHLVKERM